MAVLVLAAATLVALASPGSARAQEGRSGDGVVEIEMTDFSFKPAKVTVQPGDTVRFVQTTATPHNVEFREVPEGATLGEKYVVPVEEIGTRAATFPPARMGPYLLEKGKTYEFVITEAFTTGTYDYVCTPHEAMGMKGKLVVEEMPGAVASGD
jgi:plastocyanin